MRALPAVQRIGQAMTIGMPVVGALGILVFLSAGKTAVAALIGLTAISSFAAGIQVFWGEE